MNQLTLESGADILFGDLGDDSLIGGEGHDFLNGNDGTDILCGDLGNDTLSGGSENDSLLGGSGDDFLSGDLGNDTLTGGTGSDTFVLQSDQGSDTILDFEVGVDLFGLAAGLSFEQLTITLDGNSSAIALGDRLLATVTGVDLTGLGEDAFISLI